MDRPTNGSGPKPKSQISAARKVNRPMVTMVVAFILMVYIDGLAQDTGGTVAIRAITRCKYFANEIETKSQTLASERIYKYNTKIEAYCVPRFLPKDAKF